MQQERQHSRIQRLKSKDIKTRAAMGALSFLLLLPILSLITYGLTIISAHDLTPRFLGLWNPAADQFALLELIVSTAFAAIPAAFITILAGTPAALAIHFSQSRRRNRISEILLSLWAGLPSVIIGMLLLAGATLYLDFNLGVAIIAVAAMTLPQYTLASLATLRQLPEDLLLAGKATGLSDWHITRYLYWPLIGRQMLGLAFLAFARANGEATAVALVAGGIMTSIPPDLNDGIQTLSMAILRGYPVASERYEAAIYIATFALLTLVASSAAFGIYLRRVKSHQR